MNKLLFIIFFIGFSASLCSANEISLLQKVQSCKLSMPQNNEQEGPTVEGAENALRHYNFVTFREISSLLNFEDAQSPGNALHYRWLFITENLPAIDSLTTERLNRDPSNITALLARGELSYKILKYDDALQQYTKALKQNLTPKQKSQAIIGVAKVLYKKSKYQESLDTLSSLIDPAVLNDDVLYNMGLALINLSRVNDAIDMFEEAIKLNPYSENAHYYLGNGYARKNYTQLREAYPTCFVDSASMRYLNIVMAYVKSGELDSARISMKPLFDLKQQTVEPSALLGFMNWSGGNFEAAANDFRNALNILPEYGRAHNGLAKSLEGIRMRVSVYRQQDSAAFANKIMPKVNGIEDFILNWKSLSPRHQKQVALAVEPWKAYIPVLNECGSKHYIKPLYEILSESPGLESLKDQRINYDSRLWDDVRGCGGFTTVTGIEDVERSIYQSYNTVLHELTHQVHGLFPSNDLKVVEDAYHAAHNREDNGIKTFMSQYQASSVYEYFAEGANAYFTYKRNNYDTKEIVHERLMALDTGLVAIVEKYVKGPNLDACYPVGLISAAGQEVEKQNLSNALALTGKAYRHSPADETVLTEYSYLYSLLNDDALAIAYAESLITHFPQKAASYAQRKSAYLFSDGDATKSVELLRQGLGKVDSLERYDLYTSLGSAYWYTGDYDSSVIYYHKVLSAQPQNPEALWGIGLAYGDGQKYLQADTMFQKAISVRNGIVELRLDYARILLQSGKLNEANKQIQEAKLLTPENDQVVAFEGWLLAKKGEWKNALEKYNQALKNVLDKNLISILRLEALKATGDNISFKSEADRLKQASKNDIPEWRYRQDKYAYVSVNEWPASQIKMLTQTTKGL